MTEKLVLVTGACGEIGQALIQGLAKQGGYRIVTADLAPLPDTIKAISAEHAQGDLVYKIKTFYDYDFDIIFHLAASLSSKGGYVGYHAWTSTDATESSGDAEVLVTAWLQSGFVEDIGPSDVSGNEVTE